MTSGNQQLNSVFCRDTHDFDLLYDQQMPEQTRHFDFLTSDFIAIDPELEFHSDQSLEDSDEEVCFKGKNYQKKPTQKPKQGQRPKQKKRQTQKLKKPPSCPLDPLHSIAAIAIAAAAAVDAEEREQQLLQSLSWAQCNNSSSKSIVKPIENYLFTFQLEGYKFRPPKTGT